MDRKFDFTRASGEKDRYVYMSIRNSELMDRVVGREDEDAMDIKRLLAEIQASCQSAHRNSLC